jgi:DNA sulfur modification protein DndB
MKPLMLPSLRARMGDWVYYVTFMRMSDIARRIKRVAEIHESKKLQDWIQREVSDRSEQIKSYLLRQKQRFFNSIIVGVYGGAPQWSEMSLEESKRTKIDIPSHIQGALGILTLQGKEDLFAIDGQHRVAAIIEAVKENKAIASDEVSVIFVSHKRDRAGMERTRRLFATLNRYAKPVNPMEIIALDEDDGIAITVRGLIDKYPLFSGDKLLIKQGKRIPASDKKSFTSIIVLYEVLDLILSHIHGRNPKEFKRFRPKDSVLKQLYSEAKSFWDLMIKYFVPLKEISKSTSKDISVESYRNRNGGSLLFRPVGLLSLANAIAKSEKAGYPIEDTIRRMSNLNLELTKEPWVGLLWDDASKRMITGKENQKVALSLILYMIGYDLDTLGIEVNKLKIDYAAMLKKPVEQVKLPDVMQSP